MEESVDPRWRKASYSSNGGGSCVEVGQLAVGAIVRDTTDREGGTLGFTAGAWRAFTVRLSPR